MRARSLSIAALLAAGLVSAVAGAQAPQTTPSAADLEQKNFLPIGPPSPLPASKAADLSGDWAMIFGDQLSDIIENLNEALAA